MSCALALVATSAAADTPATTTTTNTEPWKLAASRCTVGRQLCWDQRYNRMDLPEMIFTGIAGAVAIGTHMVHPLNTGWTGGILIDDQVRNALRLTNYNAALTVRTVSDLGLALLTAYPVVVDSFLVAYWYRGSADVGLQMALIDAEAYALSGAIQGVANFFAGRARPYSSLCGAPGGIPSNTIDCREDTEYRSFFSGHAAVSFTAAALICAHHEELHLFDSAADHISCITGELAAAAVGVMRIIGDEHYFSDVMIGALVGTAVGLSVPLLHHYSHSSSGSGKQATFRMNLIPGFPTTQIVGRF